MGPAHPLSHGVVEPEAPSGGEATPLARDVRVSRTAHGSCIGQWFAEWKNWRWVGRAREAHVLLLWVPVHEAFPGGSSSGGSLSESVQIFEDIGSELLDKEVQRRLVVRE